MVEDLRERLVTGRPDSAAPDDGHFVIMQAADQGLRAGIRRQDEMTRYWKPPSASTGTIRSAAVFSPGYRK